MSNESKSNALGMNFGTASSRLRKTILYSMLYGKVYDRNCFRCGQEIEDIDDLSVEHKEPWQFANDPKAAFFDLENIAFSHLSCNSGAGNYNRLPREECYRGHPLTGRNRLVRKDGRVQCRICRRASQNTDAERQRKRVAYKNTRRIAGAD